MCKYIHNTHTFVSYNKWASTAGFVYSDHQSAQSCATWSYIETLLMSTCQGGPYYSTVDPRSGLVAIRAGIYGVARDCGRKSVVYPYTILINCRRHWLDFPYTNCRK